MKQDIKDELIAYTLFFLLFLLVVWFIYIDSKCEKCWRLQTHTEVEIEGGKKVRRQYCDEHYPESKIYGRHPKYRLYRFD